MRVNEDDPPSLEYIEDPYIPKLDHVVTPSLDDITEYDESNHHHNWSEETELSLRSLTLDQILGPPSEEDEIDTDVELQTVEAEFTPIKNCDQTNNSNKLLNKFLMKRTNNKFSLFTRKKIHDVKVTFIDFSKPYLAKISSGDNYKSFLNIGSAVAGKQKKNTKDSNMYAICNSIYILRYIKSIKISLMMLK